VFRGSSTRADGCVRRWRTGDFASARGRESTARTTRTCGTGPGRT